ncbi:hypothetical protein [Zhongshania arctica]|uniref:Uncharacterized protein n=1 Tax=Zhongshania arctica TaxID=3238302 RepID=A0ABV3U026_9GAMM
MAAEYSAASIFSAAKSDVSGVNAAFAGTEYFNAGECANDYS